MLDATYEDWCHRILLLRKVTPFSGCQIVPFKWYDDKWKIWAKIYKCSQVSIKIQFSHNVNTLWWIFDILIGFRDTHIRIFRISIVVWTLFYLLFQSLCNKRHNKIFVFGRKPLEWRYHRLDRAERQVAAGNKIYTRPWNSFSQISRFHPNEY